MISVTEFNQVLATALTPITLISGVGLLMICMTNRYNHTTNRIRQLMARREAAIDSSIESLADLDTEIDLIFMRASLLRRGMLSVALSAACSAVLVTISVLSHFLSFAMPTLEGIVLVAAIALIVLSALLFSAEINLSLQALRLVVGHLPAASKETQHR